MANTYLTVPFKEKDSAKALGARWDGEARKWYVPNGQDLTPFAQWLSPGSVAELSAAPAPSASRDLLTPSPASTDLQVPPRGVPLSRLLAGVARAVADAYDSGVWTTAEVLRASARNGHVYLELSERDADGRVVAKANAAIWARTAQRIIPEFERATGATLGDGIKLLVRAKPVFKAEYGFSLEIDAIDPTYTLGDLEARKREIRERLKHEQLFDRNKRLAAPWDFLSVLVVSPESAAGLGDFAAEADRLARYGVCRFHYVHSRFQGEGAAAEVREALIRGLRDFDGRPAPDAVIIIRGGGAVNDLAWLNDYDLARFICECPIPVFTGIGHERDNTVLDEVAHQRFDTPSKVAVGIEQLIMRRAQDAQAAFDMILRKATTALERVKAQVDRLDTEVKANATATITGARATCAQRMAGLKLDAVQTVHRASRQTADLFSEVRTETMQTLSAARQLAPAAMEAVKAEAFASIRGARQQLQTALPATLDRARLDARRAASTVDTTFDSVIDRSRRTLRTAADASQALFREVAGQGPAKTLGRGFAMVRDSSGRTVTTAQSATDHPHLAITFHDGSVRATVTGGPLEGALPGTTDNQGS